MSNSGDRPISRRRFLAAAAGGAALLGEIQAGTAAEPAQGLGFPLADLHVHLDNSTIDKVLELSRDRGVRFGIVEHAGTKENKYPVVLSNDAELGARLDLLAGKPVWKGVQAEWTDWMGCFSPEALAKLDYVLTDAMTFPGKDGRRMKLWESGADLGEPRTFMDRYVEWYVEIIEKQPIDILANVSWLPKPFDADHQAAWSAKRVEKVVAAAVKHGVAIEISSSFRLPRPPFLKIAREAGAKFCFGSNGRYPEMGKLEYSMAMARELGLSAADMFTPAPDGKKAVQRRKGLLRPR
jgi:histidinol phosphatase-like PHP family hydrolase